MQIAICIIFHVRRAQSETNKYRSLFYKMWAMRCQTFVNVNIGCTVASTSATEVPPYFYEFENYTGCRLIRIITFTRNIFVFLAHSLTEVIF